MIKQIIEKIKYHMRLISPGCCWICVTKIRGKILKYRLYRDFIKAYQNKELPDDMKCCVSFIKKNGVQMYPYSWYKNYFFRNIDIFYDTTKKLHYVMHVDKKLYFPREFSKGRILSTYNDLCAEQYKSSAHRYFDTDFSIEGGKCLSM